jgi:hypothetical protein
LTNFSSENARLNNRIINLILYQCRNFNSEKGILPRNGITAGITFLYPNFWKKIAEMRGKN